MFPDESDVYVREEMTCSAPFRPRSAMIVDRLSPDSICGVWIADVDAMIAWCRVNEPDALVSGTPGNDMLQMMSFACFRFESDGRLHLLGFDNPGRWELRDEQLRIRGYLDGNWRLDESRLRNEHWMYLMKVAP